VKLDVVRGNPGLRRAVLHVEEPDAGSRSPFPFRSAKSLDGPGTEPHALVSADLALAICDFFGELDAPLQVVSGNSTIMVLDGALGTLTTK
jgi:hypothetical protein